MKIIRFLIILIFSFSSLFCVAQRGKDGPKTISSAATIVNEYTTLTANASAGSTSVTVANSSLNSLGRFPVPLTGGDLIMIIQIQGANIQTNVQTREWGKILNYNNCGLYEFAQVLSVPNSTTINIECALINNYTAAGRTEVIRVPRYSLLTINSGGELTGDTWNGSVGGVCVVEVLGNTIINNGGKIDMTGKGFRGGVLNDNNYSWGIGEYFYPSNDYGAEKGEGIVGFESDYDALGGRYCRGAPANGGGGANTHNHGGGGGSNAGDTALWTGQGIPDISNPSWITAWNLEGAGFANSTSSGGGRGGYSFTSNDQDALTLGPWNVTSSTAWGGDYRRWWGGLGGRPLDYSTGRIFMGGGGGAGEQNDGKGSSGANGGGIIFIQSYGSVSGSGSIINNGAAAVNSTSGTGVFGNGGADGAGGGGGGGTIIIKSTGTSSGITANANGGNGGNQVINSYYNSIQSQAEGPGGGGGGGYIAKSGGTITSAANGGACGTTNSSGLNEFPPNGATKGGTGINNAPITTFYINAPDDTVCPGGSVTLTATLLGSPTLGTVILWYDSIVGGNLIGTGPNYTTPALYVTTTFYVSTCPGTYHQPVTVYVNNFFAEAGPDVSICNGGSTTLNASGGISYSWSPSAGLSNTGISNPTANPSTTTLYYVSVTNSDGCTAIDSVQVLVGANNNAVAGNYVYICNGTSINLSASGGTIYSWSPASGLNDPNIANPIANPAISTTYVVNVSDGSGCSDADTVVVNVYPALVADAGADTTLCSNASVQLHASGGVSYAWAPPSGLSDTNIYNPVANPSSTTTYSVTVTDANGCTGSDNVTLTVASVPAVTVSPGTPSICTGGSIQLTASGGTNYIWAPSSGLSSTSGANVTANPSVTTIYTVNATNTGGCTGSASVTVNVGSNLVVSVSPDTSIICQGSNIQLTANGAQNYSWSPGNGLSTTTGQTVIASPQSTTTYIVNGTDGSGCTGSTSITVYVNQISATATSTNENCGQSDGSASVNTTGVCDGEFTFLWNTTPQQTTPVSVNLPAGTYTVTVSCGSCDITATAVVANNGGISLQISNILNASCNMTNGGASVTPSGGTPPYTYNWNTSPAQTSQNLQNVAAGNYTVSVTDAGGCSSTESVTITQTGVPVLTVSSVNEYCRMSNGSAVVNVFQGSGNYSYTWSTNPPQTSNIATGLSAGTYTVTVNDGGCTNTTSVNVLDSYDQAPTAGFNVQPSILTIYDGDATFYDNSSGNIVSWQWSFGDGNTSISAPPVSHTYNNIGTYMATLIVTDSNGCTDTYSDTVFVNDIFTLYVPNSFTPNGDGINDAFFPKGINIDFENYEMTIYDRWGNLTFKTTNYNEGWNGTYMNKGNLLYDIIVDVYVYKINVTEIYGLTHQYFGRVTVLR